MTDQRIVVGSTVAPYVASHPDRMLAWLKNAESMDATFFCAIETDGRGLEPFKLLTERLEEVQGTYWTFSLDDGNTEYTTHNRLRRITMGQNLATYFALDSQASHLLFMAADCQPPADAVPKLLEVNWPIVGGECPTYCLHGSVVSEHPLTGERFPFPVQEQMASAAFVMLRRDLLRKVRWRYDIDAGMTDDPCLQADAEQLGFPTLVRKDCIGTHYPQVISPMEVRYPNSRMIER